MFACRLPRSLPRSVSRQCRCPRTRLLHSSNQSALTAEGVERVLKKVMEPLLKKVMEPMLKESLKPMEDKLEAIQVWQIMYFC